MLTRSFLPVSIAALLLLLIAPTLHAQQEQSPEERARLQFEAQLSLVVKSMTERSNADNADLNAHLSEMNAHDPLTMKNLDSAHVADNVPRILEFIEFLKHARTESDTLARNFEDSLYMLVVKLPPDINATKMKDMDEAFHKDRDAFNVFLDDMSTTYSDVLDVLLYLQQTPYSLANDKFTFPDKKNVKDYDKRMKIVDADTKELKKANKDMQKANAAASKLLKDPGDALDGTDN